MSRRRSAMAPAPAGLSTTADAPYNDAMTTLILRTERIRAIEARHADADPPLMERAGGAAAALAERLRRDDRPILIVAGPGNNGGDGLVAARLLREAGIAVSVVLAGDRSRLPHDAAGALESWHAIGGRTLEAIPDQDFGLAVDALFGIGLTRPLQGPAADLIERLERLDCPRLALDIPSGLCAATGRALGRTVRADRTLSFIAGKPGLYTLDGPDHCGEITIDDLGIGPDPEDGDGELIAPASFGRHLHPRPRNSHKGSFGSVAVIGGAPGMAGAALLAGRAALRLGSGRVYLSMLAPLTVDPFQPELMLRRPEEVRGLATALVIGPGLGQSTAALELVRSTLTAELPLVVDADALNLLADHRVAFNYLAQRRAPTVLTPHPGEAGRLLGIGTEAVQADRLAAATALAARSRALVALKGCGTVLAAPSGRWWINPSGNPGLAAAGSGDVLAGMLGALLAQGWPAEPAALAAVHIHGAAADVLVADGIGPAGLTASELIDSARRLLNRWQHHD